MLVPRQQYSRELKIAAMREIDSGKGIAEVARMYQLSPRAPFLGLALMAASASAVHSPLFRF